MLPLVSLVDAGGSADDGLSHGGILLVELPQLRSDAMVLIGPFKAGDCYVGDPSDRTHGRDQTRPCKKCGRLVCNNHWHIEVDQRFCILCWAAGAEARALDDAGR